MKYRVYLVLILSGLNFGIVGAQSSNYSLKRKNSVEITSAGLGLHISASYGRELVLYPNGFLDASAGIGRTFGGKSGTSIPHRASVNFGSKDKFIELGLGGVFWRGNSDGITFGNYHLAPLIGFRKIFYNHHFLRLTFDPLIRVAGDPFIGKKRLVPYFGGSYGITF